MSELSVLPLFPLGSVLLPGNYLKLHVFELRFRNLVRDCINHGSHFGVVYYTGENLCRIGTSARIIDIPKAWPDGRMDIVCSGRDRFEIQSIHDSHDYSHARVRFLEEDDDNTSALEHMKSRIITLLRALSSGTGKPLAAGYLDKMTPRQLCFLLGNTDLLDHTQRQTLLETDSLSRRMNMIMNAANLSLHRMHAADHVQELLGPELKAHHFFN